MRALLGIASGPDGALWFAEFAASRIGRMTVSGELTEFSSGITAPGTPWGITVGPDGAIWFEEL